MGQLQQSDADRARYAARKAMTKDERRQEKRRLQGHYDDDPEFQAAHGGEYVQRTSHRWMGRTKGQPFSRCVLKGAVPAHANRPAVLSLSHPTRGHGGRVHTKKATPELANLFYPGFAANPFLSNMLFGV